MTRPSDPARLTGPLEIKKLDELYRFLLSDITPEGTMTLDCLDGYLTAIVIGPTLVKTEEWLPGIWGPNTSDEPVFETKGQAQYILELIMRHINGIIASLQHEPSRYRPVFENETYQEELPGALNAGPWAQGFMRGIKLREQEWKPFLDDPDNAAVLRPIYLLDAGKTGAEDKSMAGIPDQQELGSQIPASVEAMYHYWLSHSQETAHMTTTFRRDQPKVGRNDPCPCGSGLKYKKCCGATPTLH